MAFIILAILPSSASAIQEKQVIMIVINQVNFQDLLTMNSFVDLIDNSGIGLMNTRTAGSATIPKAYATIGAGSRAEGNWITSQAFHTSEEKSLIYYSRTGRNAPANGVVNLDINKIISYNDMGEYKSIA